MPKLLASFVVLVLVGPWMTQLVVDYSDQLFQQLIEVAQAPRK
ncbi:flagellar biosynthetic protein FliQ [Klebsiella pneumoniae]|nr:flagellar biosynthetic protein FliQ [Klebsiella pneumoniae]